MSTVKEVVTLHKEIDKLIAKKDEAAAKVRAQVQDIAEKQRELSKVVRELQGNARAQMVALLDPEDPTTEVDYFEYQAATNISENLPESLSNYLEEKALAEEVVAGKGSS